MPVYNGAPYLAEALDSVLAQTLSDFDFIVVDDGSTDATPELLADYGRRDHRVRVHRQDNRGHTAALIAGCRLAEGEYIARMDADDVASPTRLERQLEFMSANPDVALLGTAAAVVDGPGRELGTIVYPTRQHELVTLLRRKNCFVHASVVFRRAAFEAVGGYRPLFRHAEDYDLWLRLAERYALANLDDRLLAYRAHVDKVTVRNIRDQVLYALVARAAAERRRATGDDGLADVEAITPGLLFEYGVPVETLERDVSDAALNWARLALRAGAPETALALASEALGAVAGPDQRARAYRITAAAEYRRGRRLAGARALATALRADPGFPARLARRYAASSRR